MTMINTNVGASLTQASAEQVNTITQKSVGWFVCKQWPYSNLAKQN